MKTYKILSLAFFLFLIGSYAYAQDPNHSFYILKDLAIDSIQHETKIKLDSALVKFHSKIQDTLRYEALLNFIWSPPEEKIKTQYLLWITGDIKTKLDEHLNPPKRKFFLQIGFYTSIEAWQIEFDNARMNQSFMQLKNAKRYAEELKDSLILCEIYNTLGYFYRNQRELDLATVHHLHCLQIAEKIQSDEFKSVSYNNLAMIDLMNANWTSAYKNMQKSLFFELKLNNPLGLSVAYTDLARPLIKLDKLDTAQQLLLKAEKIQRELNVQFRLVNTLCHLCEIEELKGNDARAYKYAKEAMSVAFEINKPDPLAVASKQLYFILRKKDNHLETLRTLEIMMKNQALLRDREVIRAAQAERAANEYKTKVLADSLEQLEKNRLIELAHDEEMRQEEKQRNIAFGAGALVLLLAGGLYSRLRYVRKSKATLQVEKERSDSLLLNILPEEIAQELKEKGRAEAKDFDMVSILFTDFKGFTEASAKMSAGDLVSEINFCFEAFDGIMEKYGIEKIKTIGDAYMAAGGLPVPTEDSVKNTVMAALEMQSFISKRKADNDAANEPAFEMRVGIHTGPVVAGIVGVKKFQYDIWGDTVNTAARMESSGEIGKVNISQATYELLKAEPDFAFESRGKIEAKGKGEMEMWFVSKA